MLRVSHVFVMSLVAPGLSALTNKGGAGTVARNVAFSHIVPYSKRLGWIRARKATVGSELVVQAPEQIMINTLLRMNLAT